MTVHDPDVVGGNGSFVAESDMDSGTGPGAGTAADAASIGTGGQVGNESLEALVGAAGSAVGPLLAAFEEAGPEAAEHLVTAAHEFSLAVKVVVDALERGLASQREALVSEAASPRPAGSSPSARASSGVRRIDLD